MWKPYIRADHWISELYLGLSLAWDGGLKYEINVHFFRWILTIGIKSPKLKE